MNDGKVVQYECYGPRLMKETECFYSFEIFYSTLEVRCQILISISNLKIVLKNEIFCLKTTFLHPDIKLLPKNLGLFQKKFAEEMRFEETLAFYMQATAILLN